MPSALFIYIEAQPRAADYPPAPPPPPSAPPALFIRPYLAARDLAIKPALHQRVVAFLIDVFHLLDLFVVYVIIVIINYSEVKQFFTFFSKNDCFLFLF
jgi:hypothetical protein